MDAPPPPAGNAATTARLAWGLTEPIHAIVYFAPEAAERYREAGLRGGWMGYFATRAGAMGPVAASVVVATFHNFQPAMVRRAIPVAWQFASPDAILTARLGVVDDSLRRLWGADCTAGEVAVTAATLTRVTERLEPDGRPLFAAHAALRVPEPPHLALWHACTLLREHRFDGHVAALTAHGVSGLDALVLAVASGGYVDAATVRRFRGWSEEEWEHAEATLRARGLLDGTRLTPSGRALRDTVEATTDALAAPAWAALETGERDRLFATLRTLCHRLEGPGGLVYPNPIGVPRPA